MALVPNYEKVLATEIIPSMKENLEKTGPFYVEFARLVHQMGPEFEKEDLFDLYCNIKNVLIGHRIFMSIDIRESDYAPVLHISEEPEWSERHSFTEDVCLDDWVILLIGKVRWEGMTQQPRF